ncbi:hypothetical protein [Demequina subtropica]|uniref:hypothetical protein n=1 Tax=Demequina subtropica TaxID=1638989 RepID=UPI0007832EF5|nr:hypothetical protein [Demequina subtropica]
MTNATPEPITQLELIALQRLYLDARYRGAAEDASTIKALFESRAKEFAVGRSLADIMDAIDEDGENYCFYLSSLDELPPAPPKECFEPRLNREERERWLRAYQQDGADWTDTDILMAMGSGMN